MCSSVALALSNVERVPGQLLQFLKRGQDTGVKKCNELR